MIGKYLHRALSIIGCAVLSIMPIGCGYSMFLPSSTVRDAKSMCRAALVALAEEDREVLQELGMKDDRIAFALSKSDLIEEPIVAHFIHDGLIHPSYFRQYRVDEVGGTTIEVRLWLSLRNDQLRLYSAQFFGGKRGEEGTDIYSEADKGSGVE
jgi:hypothetical protein